MRRSWRRVAVAFMVLVAVAGLLATLLYVGTAAPFVAGVATRFLARRVEINEISLRLRDGLHIGLRGIRIFETLEADSGVLLWVPRARAEHSWPRLLAGQVVPLRWALEFPELFVRLPELSARGDAAGGRIPPLELSVLGGSIEIDTGEGDPFLVRDLSFDMKRSALLRDVEGRLLAWVSRGGRSVARLSGDFGGRLDDAVVDARIDEVDLMAFGLGDSLTGTAAGTFALEYDGTRATIDLDVEVAGLAIEVPGLRHPIAPEDARVAARIEWEPDGWTIEPHPLAFDDLEITGRLHVGRGKDARVTARLDVADFQPGRPARRRLQLISLLGHRFQTWQSVNDRIEQGTIEDFAIELDLPISGLETSLAFSRRLEPRELKIRGRVRDGVYRPSPGSQPLEDMSGQFSISGNVLRIEDLEMSRGGQALPRLDIEVDGMHRLAHLPVAERGQPKGPGVPIPGLGPATSSFGGTPVEGRAPTLLRLSDFQIGHGAFLLQLRDATGQLRFPPGKLVVEETRGVLGGAPAEIEAVWDREARHVSVSVRYDDGDAPPWDGPSHDWASGSLEIQTLHLGRWEARDVTGDVRLETDQVHFSEIRGLVAGGPAIARGGISLAEHGVAPYAFEVHISEADARAINRPLGMPDATLAGRASMNGTWKGRLQPDHDFLEYADVDFDVELVGGTVAHLPSMLVLARLPSLQGVRGLFGRPLPFDQITASFTLSKGVLRTEDLSIAGPELRMLAAGEIDLASKDRREDVLLAILFFETVGRMVERLPILGQWMLGEEKSLVTLYVRLRGPWERPQATLLPPSTVQTAAGWAGKIIGGGVGQLRKILTLGRPNAEGKSDESQRPSPGP